MDYSRQRFSYNVKASRLMRGMSQIELSRASGVSASALSRIESNEREPRLSTIVRLARTLDLDLEELMRGVR